MPVINCKCYSPEIPRESQVTLFLQHQRDHLLVMIIPIADFTCGEFVWDWRAVKNCMNNLEFRSVDINLKSYCNLESRGLNITSACLTYFDWIFLQIKPVYCCVLCITWDEFDTLIRAWVWPYNLNKLLRKQFNPINLQNISQEIY